MYLAAAVVSVTAPGRRAAQRSMSALSPSEFSCSRNSAGASTTICLRVIIAEVRAFTAVSRATFSWRIISACPSPVLGIAVAVPAAPIGPPLRHRGCRATALLGMGGFVVGAQTEVEGELWLAVETTAVVVGCGGCGTRAVGHGRRQVKVRDLPMAGRPVVLVWSRRLWRCPDQACSTHTWTEASRAIRARLALTERARAEICRRVGQDEDSVAGVARAFGVGWHTAMAAVRDHGSPLVEDPARLEGVGTLGLDETRFLSATPTHRTQYVTGSSTWTGPAWSMWCPAVAPRPCGTGSRSAPGRGWTGLGWSLSTRSGATPTGCSPTSVTPSWSSTTSRHRAGQQGHRRRAPPHPERDPRPPRAQR